MLRGKKLRGLQWVLAVSAVGIVFGAVSMGLPAEGCGGSADGVTALTDESAHLTVGEPYHDWEELFESNVFLGFWQENAHAYPQFNPAEYHPEYTPPQVVREVLQGFAEYLIGDFMGWDREAIPACSADEPQPEDEPCMSAADEPEDENPPADPQCVCLTDVVPVPGGPDTVCDIHITDRAHDKEVDKNEDLTEEEKEEEKTKDDMVGKLTILRSDCYIIEFLFRIDNKYLIHFKIERENIFPTCPDTVTTTIYSQQKGRWQKLMDHVGSESDPDSEVSIKTSKKTTSYTNRDGTEHWDETISKVEYSEPRAIIADIEVDAFFYAPNEEAGLPLRISAGDYKVTVTDCEEDPDAAATEKAKLEQGQNPPGPKPRY